MQQDIVLFSKNGHVVLVLAQGLDGLRDLNGHSTVVAEDYLRNTGLWETTTTCAPEYLKDVEKPKFSGHVKTFLRTIERKVVIANPKAGIEQDLQGLKKYLEVYGKKAVLAEGEGHIKVTCPSSFVNGIISLVEKYGYWVSEIQEAPEIAAEDVVIPQTERPTKKKKSYAVDNFFVAFLTAVTSEYLLFMLVLWLFAVVAPAFITAGILLLVSLIIAKVAGDFALWWILPSAGLIFGLVICQILWADRVKQDKKPANTAC